MRADSVTAGEPTRDELLARLVESYHVISSDPCHSGAFYRRGRHGLAHRIRELLLRAGISVPDPAPKPTYTRPSNQESRPVLTLVPGGAASADEDDLVDDPTRLWRMEGGEA